MRAVRLHGVGDLRLEQVPEAPAPGPGEVRLRVTAAGICGSDLHNFRTGLWISRAPVTAGHEFAGVILALGAGVTGLAPGDAVAVDSRVTCGACRNCREGRGQICSRMGFVGEVIEGGFAESVTLPARLVLKAPVGVEPRHLAMAEPLAVALHALNRLALPAGAPLLVAGCGSIGGFAALLAARAGHPLLLADRNTARAALVAAVTGGRVVELTAAGLGDAPPRHVIEATGAAPVIAALPGLMAGGGAIALVGISHGALPLDPNLLVEREIALLGCHAFGEELPQVLAMLPDLAADLTRLIDAEVPLEGVVAAYGRLLAGEARGLKTLILPQP
ncbi:zinc-dependent alcohol dehydrogenase [Rhodobacter ferrooxidans]|uniref:Alcohol dehydrogenase GroES domain protein n=1 Tax=Rhodobacter ferrooxidans TaxID=371731 RepID=C8RZG6_9RHOB|nr:alcohol dehydrogenase catalytic domain-containing protein [Rhodobacter sp. SW2]EEW25763.1 Alcohol dehydrogenase GroES domain protein [Rhodobacter sp. SW2]